MVGHYSEADSGARRPFGQFPLGPLSRASMVPLEIYRPAHYPFVRPLWGWVGGANMRRIMTAALWAAVVALWSAPASCDDSNPCGAGKHAVITHNWLQPYQCVQDAAAASAAVPAQ